MSCTICGDGLDCNQQNADELAGPEHDDGGPSWRERAEKAEAELQALRIADAKRTVALAEARKAPLGSSCGGCLVVREALGKYINAIDSDTEAAARKLLEEDDQET